MKTQRYPARLGDLRVSEALHQKLLKICEAQDMSLADVRREALSNYCQPPTDLQKVDVKKLIIFIDEMLAEDEAGVTGPVKRQIVAEEELGNKVECIEEGE